MGLYKNAMAHGLAMPTPVHAQTEAAEKAREAIRRYGWNRRFEQETAKLVADHGRPATVPWPGEVVSRGAAALAKTAEAKGWRVNVIELADRCTVEGIRGNEAFRATWVRGRAFAGSWHESRIRYALTVDPRPAPEVSKLTRTSKAGHRPVGAGRTRLDIVASPAGMPIGVTAVIKRVTES